MEHARLRLRAGRTWRLNPVYREALLGLSRHARPDVSEAEVLDVLSVELDGVDLAGGVREDHVFRVVGDLARAAERLARGAPKASLTFGTPAVELLFVRRGPVVLLSLVTLGPSPEVRVRDVEVDASLFFEAVRTCVEALLADLRALDPALTTGPYGARLTVALRHLRARRRRERAEPDAEGAQDRPRRARGSPEGSGEVSCGFEMVDDGTLLASFSGDAEGDLHSLLAPGRVHLHVAGRGELVAWESPPFLAFRALVGEIRELVPAWEAGDAAGHLHFGSETLVLDLAGGELRAPGGRAAASPLAALAAILRAALDFCAAVVSRTPTQRANTYLADLATDAAELHARCRQILDGDVTATRPPRHETLGPAGDRSTSARPLAQWKLRRLALRTRWRFDAGPLLAGGLVPFGRRLLVVGEDGAFALERATGAVAWAREQVQAAWVGPRRTDPILLAGPMGLDLVTPGGATAWSAPLERAPSPAEEHYLAGSSRILVSLDGHALTAFEEADGQVAWRFVPPGARRSLLCGGPGGAVLSSDTGFTYGLDPSTGRVRFRVRTGVVPQSAPVAVGPHVVVVGESASGPTAVVLDARSGGGTRTHALPVDAVGAPLLFGGRVLVPARVAGEAAVVALRPGPDDAAGRILLPGLEGLPELLPIRGRLYASDRRGTVAAFSPAGALLWRCPLPAHDHAGHSPPRLVAARGVLLVAGEGVSAFDAESGDPLGSLPLRGTLGTHLLADDKLSVWLADREGGVHALVLGTHLSLVG